MRILHLSDLHRAGSSETLKAIWNGPRAALGKLPRAEQRFDFIVVSGDLAGAARPLEYDELLEFSIGSLLPLLRDPEARERLVFVPGNHDVDWTADIGEPLRLADMLDQAGGSEALADLLRRYRLDPPRSGVRQIISKFGHIEWLRLDPDKRGNRFAAVQRFLDDFYGDRLDGAPHRKFDLTRADEGHDWSAHVFPGERLAIYGFNSCYLSDRHWTGAAISRGSIAHAAAHADEHADQCLRLAVWHHGIHTDSYRPDYLNQADLGAIVVAGFQVGLHGHIHRSTQLRPGSHFSLLGDRFVLIGVGSLGTNQNHRPDAVGRQFAVVDVHPHQAHVQVYERGRDTSIYLPHPARTYALRHERDDHEASAGEHSRTIHVDRQGIATVDVAVTDLRAGAPVVIAEVGPPVCDAVAEPARGREIRQSTAQDGTIRFTLYPHEAHTPELRWRYQASNVIALTQAEAPLYHVAPARSLTGARDTTVLRAHIVRFACRRLALTFTFDEPAFDLASVEKRVDRCVEQGDARHWERDEVEQRRCELVKRSDTEVMLAIEAPIVGHRYAITYQPRRPGHPLNFNARWIAAKLLDRIYRDREAGYELFEQLSAGVAGAIAAVFEDSLDALTWIGHLWDHRQGRLLPAFGDFPSRAWSHPYPYGAGVAGHAFRFNRPAAWCRTAGSSDNSLLVQRGDSDPMIKPEHDWILCAPLVGDLHKNPIGVIQFEGVARQQGLGGRLSDLANAAIHNEVVKGSAWEVLQQSLSSTVNTGFWQACALASGLVDYRDYVRDLIGQIHLGADQLAAAPSTGA